MTVDFTLVSVQKIVLVLESTTLCFGSFKDESEAFFETSGETNALAPLSFARLWFVHWNQPGQP